MGAALNHRAGWLPERLVASSWAFLLHGLFAATVLAGLSQKIVPPAAHGGFEVVDLSAYGASQPVQSPRDSLPESSEERPPIEETTPEPPSAVVSEETATNDALEQAETPATEEELTPTAEPSVLAAQPKRKPPPPRARKTKAPIKPSAPLKEPKKLPRPPQETVVSSSAGEAAFVPPDSQTAYLRNPKPAYPKMARLKGWEGVVVLTVEVAADGNVDSLRVKTTSGYSMLDNAALSTVKRWRFSPATRGSTKVRAVVDVPIRFQLNQSTKGRFR